MPDRTNVDVEGLRDRIEAAYADAPFWKDLSFARKLRRLLEDMLDIIEAQKAAKTGEAEKSS